MVSRRGRSCRHLPEGLFGWEDGIQCNFPSPLHSSAHQMRNAGPSGRKHVPLPLSLLLPASTWERNRGVCLPHAWRNHPKPVSVCCTGVCAALVAFLLRLTVYLSCQFSFSSWSRYWSVQSTKTFLGKVLLSLSHAPFPNSCSPVERR